MDRRESKKEIEKYNRMPWCDPRADRNVRNLLDIAIKLSVGLKFYRIGPVDEVRLLAAVNGAIEATRKGLAELR